MQLDIASRVSYETEYTAQDYIILIAERVHSNRVQRYRQIFFKSITEAGIESQANPLKLVKSE